MTTETKWTPGPWRVERRPDKSALLVIADEASPLSGQAYGRTVAMTPIGGRYDAHLIAAAPDLYAALRFLLDMAPSPCPVEREDEGNDVSEHRKALRVARAALARAEGRS